MTRKRGVSLLATTALLALTACGGTAAKPGKDPDAGKQAADTTTCSADAKQLSSLPAGFPKGFYFPDRTTVFHAEDRGADGVIVTGISRLSLKDVIAAYNGPAQKAGWKITNGETETHDAEANWEGNGYRGRWALKDSASCPGELVVQVLAKKG